LTEKHEYAMHTTVRSSFMMQAQQLRRAMQKGCPVIGSWLQLPCPDVAEIMAKAGYAWLAVDMEHGAFERAALVEMFRAVRAGGAVPMARLAGTGREQCKAALEAGAQGLIFPMIESRNQLDAAFAEALYPQAGGVRGVGYCRANGYGQDMHRGLQQAGQVLLVAQIEHKRALMHIDALVSHPRLDAIMVGPYDLSASLGKQGEKTGCFNDPEFIDAMTEITQACARHHVPMGAHIVHPNPQQLKEYIGQGYTFLAYGIDSVFLWQHAACPCVVP
jgi:2-dehydro-3-deoxyglucarate aldolase